MMAFKIYDCNETDNYEGLSARLIYSLHSDYIF